MDEMIGRIRQNSSIFDDIPDSVIRQLLRKVRPYESGTILLEEGRRSHPSFYIVLRGKAHISVNGTEIADFSGFQIFGES